MLFIEVLAPPGLLDTGGRADLAGRLSARNLLGGSADGPGSTDPGVLDLFASLSHVVIREPEAWFADGVPVTAVDGPRFVVRVYAGAWAKEMADHLVTAITRALADVAGDRVYAEPRAVVHVIGVADGGYGVYGVPHRPADLLERIESARTREPGQAPAGTFVDPVCGAVVVAGEAVTVELDGTAYGFCCAGCRGRYVKRHRAQAPSS
ncbi:MAG TPA: hypothetical protein VGL93_23335 [Streptosporangiaceae bacterium]|jgi:hypothetical protein